MKEFYIKSWLSCYYQNQASNIDRTSNWKYFIEQERTTEGPSTESKGKL
jgi:hypothetical protein